jgi:predicted transcriptional regulator
MEVCVTQDEILKDLLTFFKALSDGNRLKIIGLLASQPYTVEQIASMLGIGVSTASHHLSRLSEANLVSARAEGHYYYYSLRTEVLRTMTENVLKSENLARLSETAEMDAFDKKVLSSFLDKEGRIKAFPSQEKKFIIVLKHVVKAFETGVHYSEKEVNEILLQFNKDTASLRRGLIEFHLMEREPGGGSYWRVD